MGAAPRLHTNTRDATTQASLTRGSNSSSAARTDVWTQRCRGVSHSPRRFRKRDRVSAGESVTGLPITASTDGELATDDAGSGVPVLLMLPVRRFTGDRRDATSWRSSPPSPLPRPPTLCTSTPIHHDHDDKITTTATMTTMPTTPTITTSCITRRARAFYSLGTRQQRRTRTHQPRPQRRHLHRLLLQLRRQSKHARLELLHARVATGRRDTAQAPQRQRMTHNGCAQYRHDTAARLTSSPTQPRVCGSAPSR